MIRRKNESAFWQLIPRDMGYFGLFRISEAGNLQGMTGLKIGGNLELKPYVASGLERDVITDFATDGVFVCGLAHSPKPIDESLCQAHAAATRASIPLVRGCVTIEPIVSSVDSDKCFGCGICEYLCPYNSIEVITTEIGDRARTISASCKGCGICASKCPRQAITMGKFTSEQILSQIAASRED